MSKQIAAHELAEVVRRLLTDPESAGELESFGAFQSFMTDIADVVCKHCGGEVRLPANPLEDVWYVGIHGNDSLPDSAGASGVSSMSREHYFPMGLRSGSWNAMAMNIPTSREHAGRIARPQLNIGHGCRTRPTPQAYR